LLTATHAMAQRGAPIPQKLAFTPYHASGIYDIGETSPLAFSTEPLSLSER
jgi:hypothetical protein